MLDFRVDTFLTVCQYMNYTKAAEALHITQPAVSQHIHYLENFYHTQLFSADGKRIRLTESGRILLRRYTAMKNDEKLISREISLSDKAALPLSFGVTRTIGDYLISKPLASYQKLHPQHAVSMLCSNTGELLQLLKNGRLELALIEGYFPETDYSSIEFCTQEYIPVCSSKKHYASPVRLKDLLCENLILRENGSGTRSILARQLEVFNFSFNDFAGVTELGSISTILEFVRAGCGITFLYRIAAEDMIKEGLLKEIPLTDFHIVHPFTFIWNKDSIYSPVYEAFGKELIMLFRQDMHRH